MENCKDFNVKGKNKNNSTVLEDNIEYLCDLEEKKDLSCKI